MTLGRLRFGHGRTYTYIIHVYSIYAWNATRNSIICGLTSPPLHQATLEPTVLFLLTSHSEMIV